MKQSLLWVELNWLVLDELLERIHVDQIGCDFEDFIDVVFFRFQRLEIELKAADLIVE
jgi:hypothetical protein